MEKSYVNILLGYVPFDGANPDPDTFVMQKVTFKCGFGLFTGKKYTL